MTAKQLHEFTARWLMALKTAQADDNRKNVRIIIDALAKAHGIPANYPPR
ncbi:hypothetical protein [Bradyrhizobium sp. AZCC 2230]